MGFVYSSFDTYIVQWIPVIRTPWGVGKYVLITGIKYTVDMRTVF